MSHRKSEQSQYLMIIDNCEDPCFVIQRSLYFHDDDGLSGAETKKKKDFHCSTLQKLVQMLNLFTLDYCNANIQIT